MHKLTRSEQRQVTRFLNMVEGMIGYSREDQSTQVEWQKRAVDMALPLLEAQPGLARLVLQHALFESFRLRITHHFREGKRESAANMRRAREHMALRKEIQDFPITGPGIRAKTTGAATLSELAIAIGHAHNQIIGLRMSHAVWKLERAYRTGVDIPECEQDFMHALWRERPDTALPK